MFPQLILILILTIGYSRENNPQQWLENINAQYLKWNELSADVMWRQMLHPNRHIVDLAATVATEKLEWHHNVCGTAKDLRTDLRGDQARQLYLLCRGYNYTQNGLRESFDLQNKMFNIYTSTTFCEQNRCDLHGEPDLELMMTRDLAPEELLKIWIDWHDAIGSRTKPHYQKFVQIQNNAARRNGYSDVTGVWFDEVEIPDMEAKAFALLEEIKPLYMLLHAVVRFRLFEKYKTDDVRQPIPAHLLRNLWAQDWSHLMDLFNATLDLDASIAARKWTVNGMVRKAEDFYVTLGLPKMTNNFWKYSSFTNDSNGCHGTAANMFRRDDFRISMCATPTMQDFYVIHHEMGHVQYYMAYADQDPLFQDGNSALHESIGDAIMLGVMAPSHLNRLGLINDEQLSSDSTHMEILLFQALMKLPQLPYALAMDKHRWDLFRDRIPYNKWNGEFWRVNEKLRGIRAPVERDFVEYFDAAGKFHVPDNTPFIRYFLSHIIQFQIFKGMCEMNVFGKLTGMKIPFNLHTCDVYGSKDAGKRIREMMALGQSKHWRELLPLVGDTREISTRALLEYFEPLRKWLVDEIYRKNIPVGW